MYSFLANREIVSIAWKER